MKIKKNYQNPKTTKRQKEEKKELGGYKGMRLDAFSTSSLWDFGPINKIILPNGKVYNVVDSDNLKID